MEQHYVLKLWEPAAPAFCSFAKPYVGSKHDLLKVAANIKNADPQSETAKAIQEYFGGNHGATHKIAYQEFPILTPVRVLASSKITLPSRAWEHLNVWDCPYKMKFESAEVSQIIVRCDGKYHRCIRAKFTDLCYEGINRIEKYKAAIRLLSESATSFRPYYDKGANTWRVDFPDRDSEEGDLLYVASEYARTGLYFPYNVAATAEKEYSGHAHSFEGVIQAMLDDPAGFTIEGFEDSYSMQEQQMLLDIQKKLLSH